MISICHNFNLCRYTFSLLFMQKRLLNGLGLELNVSNLAKNGRKKPRRQNVFIFSTQIVCGSDKKVEKQGQFELNF